MLNNRLSKPTTTILALPYEIINHILDLCYHKQQKLKQIYYMIISCRQLYYGHLHLLYTYAPIHLSMIKQSGSLSLEGLRMVQLCCINKIISEMVWCLTPRLTTSRTYQQEIMDSVRQFSNLTTLAIVVNSLSLFNNLSCLPSTLSCLKIILDGYIASTTDIKIHLNTLKFQLTHLEFKTRVPLGLKKCNNFISLIKNTYLFTPPLYSWVSVDDNIPFAQKDSPISQVCGILSTLVYASRSTLEYLSIQKLHPAFLFRAMNKLFFPNGNGSFFTPSSSNYEKNKLPVLKVLRIDNIYQLTNNVLIKLLGRDDSQLVVTSWLFLKETLVVKLDEANNLVRTIHKMSPEDIKQISNSFKTFPL
ncbi:hypothetical protein G210_5506, partial [Candida maltosa Xu316]